MNIAVAGPPGVPAAITTTEDVGAGKPDPEGFLLAFDLLNRVRPGDPPDRASDTMPGPAPPEPSGAVVFADVPDPPPLATFEEA